MTTLSKISTGAIALVGLIALVLPPTFAADKTIDDNGSKGKASEAKKPKATEPVLSDKTPRVIEEEKTVKAKDQGEVRSGLKDLSNGADSHLGPH